MPAPNTSVAPVPPTNNRNQLVIFLTLEEHLRFKQYASKVERTMSDIVREYLMPFFSDSPPQITIAPDPIKGEVLIHKKHLDVSLDPDDCRKFKKYAISLQLPVTQVARKILYPLINGGK